MPLDPINNQEWVSDCMKWRRRVLTGKYTHWCFDWDELPIDETCPEWPCECAQELIQEVASMEERGVQA
jgi:hypothetical protein